MVLAILQTWISGYEVEYVFTFQKISMSPSPWIDCKIVVFFANAHGLWMKALEQVSKRRQNVFFLFGEKEKNDCFAELSWCPPPTPNLTLVEKSASLASYLPLTVIYQFWLLRPPPPQNFKWSSTGRYGYFLELHNTLYYPISTMPKGRYWKLGFKFNSRSISQSKVHTKVTARHWFIVFKINI